MLKTLIQLQFNLSRIDFAFFDLVFERNPVLYKKNAHYLNSTIINCVFSYRHRRGAKRAPRRARSGCRRDRGRT